MRPRGYSVPAHVRTQTDGAGHVTLTEAGVAVQGSRGEQQQTVT